MNLVTKALLWVCIPVTALAGCQQINSAAPIDQDQATYETPAFETEEQIVQPSLEPDVTDSQPAITEDVSASNTTHQPNASFWIEVENQRHGVRFAVPCFWEIKRPNEYRADYQIKNFTDTYAMENESHPERVWQAGGVKIDIHFSTGIEYGISPGTSLSEFVKKIHAQDSESKLIALQKQLINGQEALRVTTESVFGTGHYYAFQIPEEGYMIFSLSPEAEANPDVQTILNSIAISPDSHVVLPKRFPTLPPQRIVHPCAENFGLQAHLKAPTSVEIGGGEAVKLHFLLVNHTDEMLYLLKWYTPLEGVAGDIFEVIHNGRSLPYLGILASRGDPSPDDYIALEPGESVYQEVNLSEVYDFSKPGTYSIGFRSPSISHIARSRTEIATTQDELGPVIIPSNIVTVEMIGS